MKRYIVRRLGYSLLSLFLLSLTIFLFVRVTGDPAVLPGGAGREPGRHRRHPRAVRPRSAALGAVLELHGEPRAGDFGQSFYYRTPVLRAVPLAAAELAAAGAGRHGLLAPDRHPERHPRRGAGRPLLGQGGQGVRAARALAALVLGRPRADPVLLRLPGVAAVVGLGHRLHLLMPAFALGWYFAAAHMRLTRSSMLEVLGSEYIKLARLKGLPESLVIGKHAFKNALIPVLTLAGINLVIMINVAVVVETVFAWPGIGRLLYEGITFRDFPVVQAVVLLGGTMIVVVNLLIDILYAVIDPRIRLER